jgi:hypothetical protein
VTSTAIITITVEVWRGTRNDFGDITRTKNHEIEGCFLAPRYSTEVNDNRTTVIVGFSLFGPPQTGDNRVFADDQIKTPDGAGWLTWNVVGEVATWQNPFTAWAPGFEAALERVK